MKTITSTDLAAVSPAPASSWTISAFTSSVSSYVTGLEIYGSPVCVTGFKFLFSDSSVQITGTSYDPPVSLSFGNLNQWTPQLINTVQSYTGAIMDRIEICKPPSTCVSAGNSGNALSNPTSVGASNVITSFYGSYASFSGYSCLTSFGVNYY